MKKLKEELAPIYLFVASIVLFILLTGLGLLHLVVKSFYKANLIYFLRYWPRALYQLWVVVKYWLVSFAISIDLFGNVICGEAIEDCVTAEENTLYGNGAVTISAATGQLELAGKLNKTGHKFTAGLSKALGQDHCIIAYQNYFKNE
jgi:hypothetical protein